MRFYLIGPLRLESEYDEQQVPPLPRLRKTQGLLAYLLLFRNQSHSRERLASLFWSDVPQERTLPNLSLALNQIRSLLTGSGAELRTDRFTVRLDIGSAWLDVAAPERGLAAGGDRAKRAEALSLYTADLLEGWNDEWCIVERERLRNMVLQAGTALVREYLAEGTWSEGVSLAQLLLAHNPLNDTLQDLCLRLLLGSGDHAEARRQYQRFASLLRSEMDLDPALSTRQLYSLAVQASLAGSSPNSRSSVRTCIVESDSWFQAVPPHDPSAPCMPSSRAPQPSVATRARSAATSSSGAPVSLAAPASGSKDQNRNQAATV